MFDTLFLKGVWLYSITNGCLTAHKGNLFKSVYGDSVVKFVCHNKQHRCSSTEGKLFNSVLWLSKKNDAKAKNIFVQRERKLIQRSEESIAKHKKIIWNLANKIS